MASRSNLPSGLLPVSVWLTLVLAAGVSGYLAGAPGTPARQPRLAHSEGQPALHPISTSVQQVPGASAAAGPFLSADGIADIASAAGLFVVHIELAAKQGNSKRCARFFGPGTDLTPDMPLPQGHYGSAAGVIVHSDGYVLTNAHVVRGADEIKVTLADGREYMATVIGQDQATDLAVIKIKASNLPCARFADSSQVRPGQWAIAIGSPFHLDHSLSLGIVSALDRTIGEPFSGLEFIQTDAAINPGSSGGPLLNLSGEVIGINCVVRSDAQNIGFAVPSRIARKVCDALITGKEMEHSYIGVRMNELVNMSLSDPSARVIISYCQPHGPAWQAGIRDSDLVARVNGKVLKSVYQLKKVVNNTPVGESLSLTILRGGQEKELSVRVAKMPSKLPSHP